MSDPIKCSSAKCGRPYNRSFTKCPFCNTPSPARPTATGPDYAAIAEQVVASHSAFVLLEFHPAAVVALDAFFDLTWGLEGLGADDDAWSPSQGQRVALVNLGAFFGELLRREFGGRWQADIAPDNSLKAQVLLRLGAQEVAVAPIAAAFQRMKNGAKSPFAAIYSQLRTLSQPVGTPTEVDGWLRYARHFAGVGRQDLVETLCRRGLALGPNPAARAELDGLLLRATTAVQEEPDATPAPVAPVAADRVSEPAVAPQPELEPEQKRALEQLALAKASFTEGSFDQSLAAFERVLEIDPANVAALIGKGGVLHALRRWPEASTWLEGFSGRYDCEPARSFLAACVADERNDVVKAHALFADLQGNPRLAEDRRALAAERAAAMANQPDVLLAAVDRIDNLAQAVAAYAHIATLYPTLAKPWCEQGVGLVMLGRTEEALACFDRAAALAPTDPTSYDHKAVALARLQRLDAALAVLALGLRHCPNAGVLLTRQGIFLTQLGRYDEAQRALAASLHLDPTYTKALAYQGDLEQKTGRTAEAIVSLERFLASRLRGEAKLVGAARMQLWALKNPGRTLDRELGLRCQTVGLAAAAAGNFGAALQSFDQAAAADPLCGDHWINRASSLHNLGRWEEALDSFRKAEQLLDVPSTPVRDGIVSCLLHLNRIEEALECHDRYEDRRGKARTLVLIGRPAEALPIYQQLVAKRPADATLLEERSAALLKAQAAFLALRASRAGLPS